MGQRGDHRSFFFGFASSILIYLSAYYSASNEAKAYLDGDGESSIGKKAQLERTKTEIQSFLFGDKTIGLYT